ncbi:frag1/DRAM/Sfk1 family domain-containing protein [Phthorimaea operculella]|nr:frag1/DRAM/Sfk1 family domain-containing protein [Phthorimaea operculella]
MPNDSDDSASVAEQLEQLQKELTALSVHLQKAETENFTLRQRLGEQNASEPKQVPPSQPQLQQDDGILRQLFMRRLPEHLQAILAASADPLDDIAARADKILEVAPGIAVSSPRHFVHAVAAPVTLAVMLNFIENLALVGLTYWPSTLYYSHHEFCFKTFIATSILYMLITYVMLTRCRKRPNLTNSEKKSLKIKLRAFVTNVASFIFVAYFFLRHNRLCEPYVYSMFALSEYVLVVSNIAFHLTTLYDRQFEYIYITSRGLAIER